MCVLLFRGARRAHTVPKKNFLIRSWSLLEGRGRVPRNIPELYIRRIPPSFQGPRLPARCSACRCPWPSAARGGLSLCATLPLKASGFEAAQCQCQGRKASLAGMAHDHAKKSCTWASLTKAIAKCMIPSLHTPDPSTPSRSLAYRDSLTTTDFDKSRISQLTSSSLRGLAFSNSALDSVNGQMPFKFSFTPRRCPQKLVAYAIAGMQKKPSPATAVTARVGCLTAVCLPSRCLSNPTNPQTQSRSVRDI